MLRLASVPWAGLRNTSIISREMVPESRLGDPLRVAVMTERNPCPAVLLSDPAVAAPGQNHRQAKTFTYLY